jgi:hypothetical protein
VRENLAAGEWKGTGEVFRGTNAAAIFLRESQSGSMRFYRVRRN